MKYENKSFTTGVNSDAYRDRYDLIFSKEPSGKEERPETLHESPSEETK